MSFDIKAARAFVGSVDLSGTRRSIIPHDAVSDAGVVFDKAKNQSQIVGSGVYSFVTGVDEKVREAISDSALLAQLVANKRSNADQPLDWFNIYAEVLQKVGWVLQDGGLSEYTTQSDAGEVNQKIIEVLAALGAAPAAVAIVTATLEALKSPATPWITLFSRESQKGKIGRFQIGLVNTDENNEVFVSLLACLVEAETNVVQVLFFKFKSARATFSAYTAKVSVNRAALADLGPEIRKKVRAYQLDYLSDILDVKP